MGLHALPFMVYISWNPIIGVKHADGEIIDKLAMDNVNHIPYSQRNKFSNLDETTYTYSK